MKRAYLIIPALLGLTYCKSQFSDGSRRPKEIELIPKTTTYVLASGKPEFDKALFKAVEENWTLSPLGDPSDLGARVDLSIESRSYVSWLAGPLGMIGVLPGGLHRKKNEVYGPDFAAYALLSTERAEVNPEQCIYRLPLMIQSLQQAIKGRTSGEGREKFYAAKEINELTPVLKGKTILVERALLNEEEIRILDGEHRFRLEYADRERIEKAIAERSPDEALMVLIYHQYFDLVIYDLADRRCVFNGRPKLGSPEMKLKASLLKELDKLMYDE